MPIVKEKEPIKVFVRQVEANNKERRIRFKLNKKNPMDKETIKLIIYVIVGFLAVIIPYYLFFN